MLTGLLTQPCAWSGEEPQQGESRSTNEQRLWNHLGAFREHSASRARDYDRSQDISPRQMLVLLEVSQRTGTSLGQMLATGEHESARTWNDHVRPTLRSGKLGAAVGVWQFQPTTFQRIIARYGDDILELTEPGESAARRRLDLSAPPFCDSDVRLIIRDTVDGLRDTDDVALLLLRQNFAVHAFAKYFLSVDSGATNPVEDYLFHFLGAGQGRRILALSKGSARHTLAVNPPEQPKTPMRDTLARKGEDTMRDPGEPPDGWLIEPRGSRRPALRASPDIGLEPATAARRTVVLQPATASGTFANGGSTWSYALPPRLPRISSEHGFPADSPTVTGNLGMFYKDGKDQSNPYTWAEFMDHLARRVKAKSQPAMVRAKYGVGFEMAGGDMHGWAFDPSKLGEPIDLTSKDGEPVPVQKAMVTGPLDAAETRAYMQRLAALVHLGEAEPVGELTDAAKEALQGLGLLSLEIDGWDTSNPEVQKALSRFRRLVGKSEPDDPAHTGLLMPAERVALEIYGRRVAHYLGLQGEQMASAAESPDLAWIKDRPSGIQQRAAARIALVQTALKEQGLLKQPKKKIVWRDKKRRKRVAYKTLPFAGKVDKATLKALTTFQQRNGLKDTKGILDAVTLRTLGLSPIGNEIFEPVSGPQSLANTIEKRRTVYQLVTGIDEAYSPKHSPLDPGRTPPLIHQLLGMGDWRRPEAPAETPKKT